LLAQPFEVRLKSFFDGAALRRARDGRTDLLEPRLGSGFRLVEFGGALERLVLLLSIAAPVARYPGIRTAANPR